MLKKNIIIGLVAIVVVVVLLQAKYKVAESIPLINATTNYDLTSLNAVAIYIQDEAASDGYAKANTIPTEGYTLNEKMSYCAIGGARDDSITLSYDSSTQTLNVSPMTTKGTKCYLYFDQASIKDTLLTYYPTVLTRTDFSTTVENTTTGTIYKSTDSTQYDDDGEVYYFAGNPTDNWVSFAGFYWRIIRVNGDGTLRLIYQGTSANTTGTGTQISTSAFNSLYSDNMYVGYMYTSGEVHGLGTSSTIKGVLDTWYTSNLSSYASYIDTNAGFCGDRSPSTSDSSSNGSGGTSTTVTYYGAYIRNTPTFSCSNSSDLYTTSSSNKGNKVLTYPIGLITADEVAYAGGEYLTSNSSYYLYTGEAYWTMSPHSYTLVMSFGYGARVFFVSDSLTNWFANTTNGVRPVINLKANTIISSGNGSSDTPFVIATS